MTQILLLLVFLEVNVYQVLPHLELGGERAEVLLLRLFLSKLCLHVVVLLLVINEFLQVDVAQGTW